MARLPRAVLHDPSVAVLVKHNGRRETEKVLLEGSIALMLNEDDTVVVELFAKDRSIKIRINPEDVKAQIHILKRWKELR